MSSEPSVITRGARRRYAFAPYLAHALALTLVPALAWTATVPHADFQAGEPIRASELNEDFAALAEAITALEESKAAGPVLSPAADHTIGVADGSGPVPGLAIDVVNGSGPVKLELNASEGGGMVRVSGSGYAWIVFRRSPDGTNWTNLTYLTLQTADLVGVPPSAFSYYDEPGPGTWHYDVHVAVFQSATLDLYSVRLVGQALGATP